VFTFYIRRVFVLFSLGSLFPYLSYLIPSWINHIYLANVPSFYRTPFFMELSPLYDFEQQSGVLVPKCFIQIYLFSYPYYFFQAHQLSFVNTLLKHHQEKFATT